MQIQQRSSYTQSRSVSTPVSTQAQQSPINLEDPVYSPELGDGIDIGWSQSSSVPATTGADGHSILMPGVQKPLTIQGKDFEPKGLHFHALSEHLVNGKPYPVEMHIVHQNDEDGTRAVMGVFIDGEGQSGSAADLAINSLLDNLEEGGKDISPSDILPQDTSKFYRYEGSLTTAPYDENVSWMVMKEPIHLAPETLARLKSEQGHEARVAQDLNRRYVLANFND